jgi:hypothetical protein
MKKEFSYYEFVGLLVPSVIFLYSSHLIYQFVHHEKIIDFSKIGDTLVFIVVCYGLGHILQALGNFFELGLWKIYKGMPTKWLTSKNRFGKNLFDPTLNTSIKDKITQKFGDGLNDYGRLTYNFLYQKQKTSRIDIFNGNYSLLRGMTVSFILLLILSLILLPFKYCLVPSTLLVISVFRMIRFSKYYATELYRTFYNDI